MNDARTLRSASPPGIPAVLELRGEPISPELALVCSELGAQARAALPDRPWEAFLPSSAPPGRRSPRHGTLLHAAARTPGGFATVGSAPALEAVGRPRVVRLDAGQGLGAHRPAGVRRWRRALRSTALAAAIPLSLGAVLWASEQTPAMLLGPPSGVRSASPTPPLGAEAAQPAVDRSRERADSPARPARLLRAPAPAPLGGYLFSGGMLVADRSGARVTLRLVRGCGAGTTMPSTPVVGGRFAYSGPGGTAGFGFGLRVTGTFVDEDVARLRVRIRRVGCVVERVVIARLT